MTEREATERLQRIRQFYLDTIKDDTAVEAVDMAISALKKQEQDRWIPVTENTLPDKGKVVIALGKKGTWDFGTYRGYFNDIHYWNWKKNTLKKVYWWMYKDGALPEPYQEKTE